MKEYFENDFQDIDANQDSVITKGELEQYLAEIGHYDPKHDDEFKDVTKCMIDLMDNPENGGNNDGMVTEREFLSYLGTKKEIWASEDLSEVNKYRPWSVLWEHLAWFDVINL